MEGRISAARSLDWRRGLPLVALVGVVSLLFWEALLGRGVFYERDIHMIWYGQVESFVHAVGSGSWPVWDPFQAFGRPLLANPNNQLLYPLTWLNLLMRPWSYFAGFVLGHFLLAAGGSYLLGRRLGLTEAGAFVAAVAWIVSGPFVSLVSLWNHLAAAAWIPWAFLAADLVASRGRGRETVLWGATLAAPVLAGSPAVLAMSGLGSTLWVLCHRQPEAGRESGYRKRLALIGGGWGFALGLSAAQWLPSLEMVRQAERWALPKTAQTAWSLHPLALLEAALPFRLGELPLRAELMASILDFREPWLGSIYLGIPVACLAIAAAGARRRGRWLFTGLALASALVALGHHTPVFGLAVGMLPPLGALRFPVKALILGTFCVSVLAGMGFDAWQDPSKRARKLAPGWLLAPALLLLLLAGSAAVMASIGAESLGREILLDDPRRPAASTVFEPTARRLGLAAAAAAATAALALLWLRGAVRPRWLVGALAAVCLADLLAAHGSLNTLTPRQLYTLRPPVLEALGDSQRPRVYVEDPLSRGPSAPAPHSLALARAPRGWPRGAALHLGVQMYLSPPTAGRWRVGGSYDADLTDLYPIDLRRLTERMKDTEDPAQRLRLLRLGAVHHAIALGAPAWLEDLELVATYPGLFTEPIRVYRVPDPLPRSYVVSGVRVAEGAAALELLLDASFEPRRELILSETEADARPVKDGFSGSSRILHYAPDQVRLEAQLDQPGYVVVVDGYDPGWSATVDGKPAEVRRANLAFRAVELPAGRHLVVFSYWPRLLSLGLLISTLALLAGLTVLLRTPRAEGR